MKSHQEVMNQTYHYIGKLGTLAGYKEALRELLFLVPQYLEDFDQALRYIEQYEEELAHLKEICRGSDRDYAHRSWQLHDRDIKIWIPKVFLEGDKKEELSEGSREKLKSLIKDP